MPRAAPPSFVCELPLVLVGADERRVLIRLDCARRVYNAVLARACSGWRCCGSRVPFRRYGGCGGRRAGTPSAPWTSSFACASTICMPMPRSLTARGWATTSTPTPSKPLRGVPGTPCGSIRSVSKGGHASNAKASSTAWRARPGTLWVKHGIRWRAAVVWTRSLRSTKRCGMRIGRYVALLRPYILQAFIDITGGRARRDG